MTTSITRRAILGLFPAGLVAAGKKRRKKLKPLPRVGEFFRFADPATENTVVRLTSPTSASLLPAPTNRFVSRSHRFLLFSSDRTGRAAPFQLNLRTGMLRPVAAPAHLKPHSLCMDEKEQFLYFIDGTDLKEAALESEKLRTVAGDVTAFSLMDSPQPDIVMVRRGRLERLNSPTPLLAEEVAPECLLRPGGAGCFFSRELDADRQEFWYAPFETGLERKPVLLAAGRIWNPFWSPDGQSLLFLRDVETPRALVSEIHQAFPDGGGERRVDSTSQFAAFTPNANASVFAGASGSKAQPNILLLVRSVQRELTLCEHRSTNPRSVSPVFSPDSRRVFFQSDREGKPALYSVDVERLVEPT